MNRTEIKTIIARARDLKWFNGKNETINFKHLELSLTFTTVASLHEYLLNQVEGWKKLEGLPQEFNLSAANFKRTLEQLEHFISKFIMEYSIILENHWADQVKPHLNILESPPNFPFDSPETTFLLDLNRRHPQYYAPAYQYITGGVENIMKSNNFKGALMAYEFTTKGKSEITKRRKLEEKSLNNLKSEFIKYLSNTDKIVLENISTTEKKYIDFTAEIDTYKKNKEEEVNSWHSATKKTFEELQTSSTQKIIDLEKAYEELLRLKKPAEYWKIRADKLNKEGWQALKWLIGLICFACLTLYLLLWLTPEGMLLSFISGNASALKWSIVYITFISFLAVGIRALTKVMFSSFHLCRDAEEREQLSYFYLALIKDSAIDKDDKHLVMQSLFSRSDTGLLREDSSPTMPGVIEKLVQK